MNVINNSILNTNYISFRLINELLIMTIALAAITIVGAFLLKLGFLPCLFKGTSNSNPDLTHSLSSDRESEITSQDHNINEAEPEQSSYQLPEEWDLIPESINKQNLYRACTRWQTLSYRIDEHGLYLTCRQGCREVSYWCDFNDRKDPVYAHPQIKRNNYPVNETLEEHEWPCIPEWARVQE